jgi:DNA-binding transcriptional LysR family regulator
MLNALFVFLLCVNDMNQKQLEGLDLNLILALYWLLTERNVTQAANKLGLSQPATSRALGRIRDLYDDPILIKSGRTMLITPLGEQLLPIVTHAVKSMRDVIKVSEPFDPQTYRGRFRIACKDHIGANVIKAWAGTI